MVRHEAAEALGSIAAPACLELLKQHCSDPEPIVAESCVVSYGWDRHAVHICKQRWCMQRPLKTSAH